MGVRTDRKAATREAIMDAAKRLFAERGLQAPSTAEIAQEAGVSHGALFVHFPRREDLQTEVIAEAGGRIVRAVHDAAEDSEKLEDVLFAHLSAIAGEERLYTWLVRESFQLGPAARATVVGVQSAVSHHLLGRGWVDPVRETMWFNSWIALVHYYLMNGDMFAPGGSVIERHGQTLVTYFAGQTKTKEGER